MDDRLLDKFHEIEESHWWWEGRRELLRLLLRGKKPRKILDVGCGTGETISYLGKLFPTAQLWGVDTSSVAISYAKRRGHVNVVKTDGKKLPFKKNYFDTILFLDVLEHVRNDQELLYEASRVLKNGGQIIITSPGLSFIWSAHDTGQGHKRRYTRRMLLKLARKAGLKVSFISYFNFVFCIPIIVIRLLSNLKPFRSFASYDNHMNYDIAKFGIINFLLREIFVFEINLLRYIKYPIGISVVADFRKR